MSTHELKTFLGTYEWAGSWQDLPWAHDEPTLFLAEICRRRPPGKALDIGCGAGTDSVFLAQQGWEVTSLDFVPKALEFTQQRAADAGVSVTAVEADITTWEPPHEYDIVLDHGLLHMVVDGGASKRCALLGDNIAEMAYKNGWSGIIINGCIRDSADIARMPLGVKAITTYPLKSSKRDVGLRDVAVTFAGATFRPGDWVHADGDGVLVSKKGRL